MIIARKLFTVFLNPSRAFIYFAIFAGLISTSGNAQPVLCPPNIDFNAGNFTNWTCYTGSCCPINTPTLSGPVANRHTITNGIATDPYGGFPIVAPGGGTYSLKIGNDQTMAQAERVRYTVHVPAGFNNYSFIFKYAIVLNVPNPISTHQPGEMPRFEVKAYDSATNNPILCATLNYYVGYSPGFINSSTPDIIYLPWTNGSVNLSGQGGNTIIIEVSSGDCSLGGHFGYGYFDVLSCGSFQAAVANCDLSNNSVTFTGPPGYQSYVWKDSTLGTTIGTGASITVPAPAVGTSYYYKVILTPFNTNGCPDTVNTPRINNFTINATPDSVCNTMGAPVQLNTAITTAYTGPFTYNWQTSTAVNTISDTAIANPLAYPQTTGKYIVKVSDTIGCYRRDTVLIQNPHYTVNLGPDLITCLGTPVTIPTTVTPSTGNYVYSWTPSANLSSATVKNPIYTPAAVGTQTYVIRVDSLLCAATDTITLKTLPNTFSINDTAVCQGVTFIPTASADTSFTFTWSPTTALSSGNILQPVITADTTRAYTVTAHYPTCPNINKTFTMRVEPVPVVNLGPDVSKCQFTPLYVFADVKPTWFTNYTYTWNPDPNINNPSIPNIVFTGQQDTTITLTVTTPLGCTGSDALHIHVYNSKFAAVTPTDTAICPRDSVTYTLTGGVSYLWVPGIYLNDSTSAAPTAHPITSQGYTVYATDINGCHDTVTAMLTVHPEALVTLPDTVTVYAGEQYTIDPQGNCLYFTWFPQNYLSNAYIANPIVTPDANTTYHVNARTEGGCVATDSITILYQDQSALDVPNAFSPGSQPNPVLKVVRRGAATLSYFRIYDRWGTKVYEGTNIDEGWDGRLNGNPQPMGVYVYQVEAFTRAGKRFYKQGNITLLR